MTKQAYVVFVFDEGELTMNVDFDDEEDFATPAEYADHIFGVQTGFYPMDHAITWHEQ